MQKIITLKRSVLIIICVFLSIFYYLTVHLYKIRENYKSTGMINAEAAVIKHVKDKTIIESIAACKEDEGYIVYLNEGINGFMIC